jgi:hypothetical protein
VAWRWSPWAGSRWVDGWRDLAGRGCELVGDWSAASGKSQTIFHK